VHLDAVWLLLAGFGGGLAGSMAGLASLVSYPALLAVGLSPIAANVTNTVSLVFSAVGSISASGPELANQTGRVRRLAPWAVAGGATGGALLLVTSSQAFALVVPWLIGLASVGVLVQPRRVPRPRTRPRPTWRLPAAVFAISIYGGYFGAASGVLLLAILLLATGEPLARANAIKNVLLGSANAVAALAFVLFGPVRWSDVLPLAVGFLVGGRLGPMVVRRAPSGLLRTAIALAGVGVAVHLGLDAYR
jgi:hypothetical protein